MAANSDKMVYVRCIAFAGEGVRRNRCTVDVHGFVRVWDSVARAYTLCHSLSPRTERRIRILAAQQGSVVCDPPADRIEAE